MAHLSYTCRNTLERLREKHDQHQREQAIPMKRMVRVGYTETIKEENGKTISTNQARILSELNSIDPAHVQHILEQEWQPTSGETAPHVSLVLTNITELKPTGDDDQM